MFEDLNLPKSDIKVRNLGDHVQIFDFVRQQWLALYSRRVGEAVHYSLFGALSEISIVIA
jgi:hypothetical protein